MFSICGISDVCIAAASSCVDGTCDSTCAPSIELTSAGAISEPSNGVSVGGTSDDSAEGTMLLISETDGSVGKGTSPGTDSEGRLCCAIMLGISTASIFTDD